ncbi:MAG: hypothetical protein ACFFDF_01965 [Candidatus Odinarchaeota archaeon]
MDPINLVKIITTGVTTSIALIIGFRVLLLNKTDWLNRWFFLFFISSSLGFLIYAIYHVILNNADIIIPLMIMAHTFFNFVFISLIMTVFVLEKYTKVAMSMKYLGTMLILFAIMSVGYIIFRPTLDLVSYGAGIVDTSTPFIWFILVNTIRVILAIYVLSRYIVMVKKIEGETRNRVKWFSIGVTVAIIGVLINVIGGLISSIVIEVLALVIVDIGAILILKGFLI